MESPDAPPGALPIAQIVTFRIAQDLFAADVRAVADRRVAIGEVISCARPGDVVVIAGKGHEQGQEFADGRKLPFDDVAVARWAMGARVEACAR